MLEMDVSIKFSCQDKELQKQLRDIFDLSCEQNRKDFLGLGELDSNIRWVEFYRRIEDIAELDQEYSLVDSYITTLKSMSSKKGSVKLHYVTGVYGKEFAEEMESMLKNLGVDDVKISIADTQENTSDEFASVASGC